MRTPDGFRPDSARTPDASRAGALHSHSHSHSSWPKAPSIVEEEAREGEKTCNRCLESKPREEFYAMTSAKDGLQSCCIDCRRAYNREHADSIRSRHRDYLRRTGRVGDPRRSPLEQLGIGHVADPSTLRRYGLTEADYEAMQIAQGFRCAICHSTPPPGERLAVDHCHDTGAVRGLLCRRCNTGIGLLRDDPQILSAAVAYLDRRDAWMGRCAARFEAAS